jgi:hypothetical protein
MLAIVKCTLKLKASPPHICLQYNGLLPQRQAVCKIYWASVVKEHDGILSIIFYRQSDCDGRYKIPLEKPHNRSSIGSVLLVS